MIISACSKTVNLITAGRIVCSLRPAEYANKLYDYNQLFCTPAFISQAVELPRVAEACPDYPYSSRSPQSFRRQYERPQFP